MSPQRHGSRPSAQPTQADPFRKHSESDNRCSDSPVQFDSTSCGDSRRAKRVGLRSGRNGPKYTLAQKLAARTIRRPNGCWEVQGCNANQAGHVHLASGSPSRPPYVRVFAHRFAWEQANGRKVPAGLVVMHRCDNPRCVNPDHLDIGTQGDNVRDSVDKGRFTAHHKTGVRLNGRPSERREHQR